MQRKQKAASATTPPLHNAAGDPVSIGTGGWIIVFTLGFLIQVSSDVALPVCFRR